MSSHEWNSKVLYRNYNHPVYFMVKIKINIKFWSFQHFSELHTEQKQDYKNTVLYQHGRNATVVTYYRVLLIVIPSLEEGWHKWKVISYKLITTSHNIKEIQEYTDCNSSPMAVFLEIPSIKIVRYREKNANSGTGLEFNTNLNI